MLLCVQRSLLVIRNAEPCENIVPLLHVLRRIHVNESRFVFGCCFPTSGQLGESRSCAILQCVSFCLDLLDLFSIALTFDSLSSVATLQTSAYFVTSQAKLPS